MNPHIHDWRTSHDGTVRRCRECLYEEYRRDGDFTDPDTADGYPTALPTTRSAGQSIGRLDDGLGGGVLVSDHGGIRRYSRADDEVMMENGTIVSVPALAAANSIRTDILRDEILRVLGREVSETVSSAGRSTAAAAEVFSRLGAAMADSYSPGGTGYAGSSFNPAVSSARQPKKLTSAEAMTLILEEIRHDPDPFKAAGEWITKFTNGVTELLRDTEDDDE